MPLENSLMMTLLRCVGKLKGIQQDKKHPLLTGSLQVTKILYKNKVFCFVIFLCLGPYSGKMTNEFVDGYPFISKF